MAKSKEATVRQLEVTNKAYELRQTYQNDNDFAKAIFRSKVTLYTRLRLSNWDELEMPYLENLHAERCK